MNYLPFGFSMAAAAAAQLRQPVAHNYIIESLMSGINQAAVRSGVRPGSQAGSSLVSARLA